MTNEPAPGTDAGVLPSRPLLPGLYHVVPSGSDRVLVANAGRVVSLSGPGLADRVGPLLAALDGDTTREDLQARFPDLTTAVLSALAAKGLLTDAAPVPGGATTAPSLASLSFAEGPSPAEGVRRLADAIIAVPSCGPVGGHVALLLAKAGVGRLVLSDFRPATRHDVISSPVFGPEHEGQPRAEIAAQLCRAVGAVADVLAFSLHGDGPPAGRMVVLEFGYDDDSWLKADACLAQGLPYLLVSQDALTAWVGPLVAAGGQPCHHCLRERRLSHEAHPQEFMAYVATRATSAPGPDAFLAAHTALLAGFVASEALRSVLVSDPLGRGAVAVLELGTMALQREVLHPVPGCAGCAEAGQSS